MLVRFSVKNCLSFRDRVELSMVASGKVRRHPQHVVRPSSRLGIPLLKLAVVYGANASGKSNLVKALAMAKNLVLHPAEAGGRVMRTPFKLDPESRARPSRFEFEIEVDDRYFAYGFSTTSDRVEEEWLFEVNCTPERPIFERTRKGFEWGKLAMSAEEEQFLRFTAKGTLPNRLFLTECRERNVRENVRGAQDIFKVLTWIEDSLIIVLPTATSQSLPFRMYASEEFKQELARYLKCFDTGIDEIDFESMEPETATMPEDMRRTLEKEVDSESLVRIGWPGGPYVLCDHDDRGTLRLWKLVARHRGGNGTDAMVTFDMIEESDGTRRLMQLVPAMMGLMNSNRLYIVDELDRSLHPDILHSYVANFLRYSLGRRSQLIVTTHDTTLLKQRFLRRDEVWFVEKGPDQSSRLVALEEFKNADQSKDLQQDYLLGRFGGVPVIRDFSWLGNDHGEGT
jgi:AAA15 family ATPase/GTPase